MARIAVDIDSTLYNFEAPARDEFMKLAVERDDPSLFMGAYHPWVEWRSPADSCGLDAWLDVIERVHSPKVILSREPFDGAVDTCFDLLESGHELIYISSRAEGTFDATHKWLRSCGFPKPDALVVCGSDKSEYLAGCQYLIDDRPKTVVDFVHDSGWKDYQAINRSWVRQIEKVRDVPDDHIVGERLAFVKAYPYNQNLTDLSNIYLGPTWAALRYYLEKKGVINVGA